MFDVGKHRGLTDRDHAAVAERRYELRRAVIVEESLVVRVLQEVLIRSHRPRTAAALLCRRTEWSLWLSWWRAAIGRNCLNEERLAIGHPLHGIAIGGVDEKIANAFCLTTCDVGGPELDAGFGGDGKGDLLAVGRPLGKTDVCAGRKLNSPLLAIRNLL